MMPMSPSPRSSVEAYPQEEGAKPAPATMDQIEQVRLLILGMEQRLQTREESLEKVIKQAESEGKKFEGEKKALLAAKS
jgi:hypothetical protein